MPNKSERLKNRATRVMGRAQKNWKKAEDAMAYDKTAKPGTSNAIGYASQKYDKAAIQETRAKKLMAKSEAAAKSTSAPTMKKGGSTKKKK